MYITPFFVNFFIGRAIESSLKHLAERRTDIFGVGEEAVQEAAIGMKKGEEETKRMGKCLNFLFLLFCFCFLLNFTHIFSEAEKNVWDGHSSSAEAAGRAARANISLNDQIEQIHRNKGLIPDTVKENIGPQSTASGPPIMPPAPVNVVSHPHNVPPQHAPQVIYILLYSYYVWIFFVKSQAIYFYLIEII